jgi:TPR repeat protein
MTPPPQETLEAMAAEDPQTMKVDELCALASAAFQGVPNVLEADQSKGVELWRIASDRGSLDAMYSLAVCLRDGKGTDKDLEAAYGLLSKLANDSNYNIAHVRAAT